MTSPWWAHWKSEQVEGSVAFGKSELMAAHALRRVDMRFAGARPSSPIEDWMEKNGVEMSPAYAFRIIDADGGYHCLFARSVRHAAQLSRVSPIRRIVRCDPWFALAAAHHSELARWVIMVWPKAAKLSDCEVKRLFPALSYMTKIKSSIKLENRERFKEIVTAHAAMLRLSMELPFIAPHQTLVSRNSKGRVFQYMCKSPPMEVREFLEDDVHADFIALHEPNISKAACERALRIAGPEITRSRSSHAETKKALAQFVSAYGYNPQRVSWGAAIALWNEGPQAMEDKTQAEAMGIFESFLEE